jgi:predicted PurR-regulated permease PerM
LQDHDEGSTQHLTNQALDLAIRIAVLALLGYWSFRIVAPFLKIALWSAILAVALHPLFDRLQKRLPPSLAASFVASCCLLIVIGPLTWLAFGMVRAITLAANELNAGHLAVLLPPDSVKMWPLIGARLHQLWTLAATNAQGAVSELGPVLKSVAGTLLGIAQGVSIGLLELLVSIVVAGFLFAHGPQMVDTLSLLLDRMLARRGKELVHLTGATIRNVSRGVVGIAVLQSVLAGICFLIAGIPAASVLAFLTLLLSIVQIGPGILFIPVIVWSWTAMEPMQALLFTVCIVPVGIIDNILRPLLIARGLTTPMPIIMIGVVGGTIAYGIVGLFFGPIVLSVAWAVVTTWFSDTAQPRRSSEVASV